MFNISVICCHSAGWYDLCVNVHSDKGLQLVGEHGACEHGQVAAAFEVSKSHISQSGD